MNNNDASHSDISILRMPNCDDYSEIDAKAVKKLAFLTSGGDSQGMNAAIKTIVRVAIHNKIEVYGIFEGYCGKDEKCGCSL